MKRAVLGIFAAIVLLILFVVLCTFVRRPYEKILIDRFGKLIEAGDRGSIAYNWYFKLPTDTLVRVDTRLHMETLPFVEYTTELKEPVSVRAFIVWRITDPVKFRQKASGSDDVAARRMKERVQGLIGQALGKHRLDQLFNSSDQNTDQNIRAIETQIAKDATSTLTEIGIQIADVGFSRIAFPPANTEEVYRRMVADLSVRARTYEADGLRDAEILRAEGVKQASKIKADATAQAENIKGGADREAASIIASVNTSEEARSFYQYWKNLDVLKTSLAKNTILVLSSDTAWLKNLFDGSQTNVMLPPFPTPPATMPTAPKPEPGK